MVAAAIVCLLLGQAILSCFWVWVVRSYGDRPIPFLQWRPEYPARSVWVMAAGVVLIFIGLGLANVELSPWQAGLLAGAVVALSAFPVYAHNVGLRRQRSATILPTSD